MRDRYASLREGLVGAWIPSVSGSGLLLPDLSGRGNNGTLTNMGPEDWVSGQYGRALDFDGSNDRVDLPGNYSPSIPMTFSAFVMRTANWDFAGNCLFWAKPNAAFNGNGLYIEPAAANVANNTICVLNGFPNYLRLNQDGNISFPLNTWAHFVVTVSNSTTGQFYLNGVPVSTSVVGTLAITGTLDTKYIFSNSPGYGNYTPGQIDDIRIYNRALSEPEIKLLASRPGIGLRPQRRTMYYAPPTGARRRRILTSMP